MFRRDLMIGAGAAVLSAAVARAETPASGSGAHAMHGGAGADLAPLLDCDGTGERCVAHCFTVIAEGDASIVGCARSVHEMLAANDAVLRLVGSGSKHAKGVATAALPVYRACEAECRKHEKKHAICGACGDACAAAIALIEKL